MHKVTVASIVMTWDAGLLVDALTHWIGTDGQPFGPLGDGGKLGRVDAEYISVWGKFFRQHREDSYVAFFIMNPIIRIAAEMFSLGMGLRLKAATREQEARSWLQEKGTPA